MILGFSGFAGVGKDTVADFLVAEHGFVKVAFADPLKRICKDVYDFSDEQLWGPSEKRNEEDKRYLRGIRLPCGCIANTLHGRQEGFWIESLRVCCSHHEPEWFRGRLLAHDDPEFKREPIYLTPRHALQQLGSEWGRACYGNTWVDYALRTAKKLLEGGCYYDARSGLRYTTFVSERDSRSWTMPKTSVAIPDVRFRNEIEAIHQAGGYVIRIRRPASGLEGDAALHSSELEQSTIPNDVFDAVIENNVPKDELFVRANFALTSLRAL